MRLITHLNSDDLSVKLYLTSSLFSESLALLGSSRTLSHNTIWFSVCQSKTAADIGEHGQVACHARACERRSARKQGSLHASSFHTPPQPSQTIASCSSGKQAPYLVFYAQPHQCSCYHRRQAC